MPVMTSLQLTMEGPRGHVVTDKTFDVLQDFLQPGTSLTLEEAAQSILNVLPDKSPYSTDVAAFGDMCVELAEQIPYSHPSQLKLVDLLEHLGKSIKFVRIVEKSDVMSRGFLERTFGSSSPEKTGNTEPGRYYRYSRLGESLLDAYNNRDPEEPEKLVNFQAFAANIHERRIFPTDPTWAIWALRQAHEGGIGSNHPEDDQDNARDAFVIAAAQWILWYGQTLFKQVLYQGNISDMHLQYWKPGPLYNGKASLSIHRWHFWRDGFKAVATGVVDEKREKGVSQECKTVSMKAANLMNSLEQNMTF